MHKIILFIFNTIKNVLNMFSIIILLCIMALISFWIQNIISVSWKWMEFLKPAIDCILNFSKNIFAFSFNFDDKVIDINYINAILLSILVIAIAKLMLKILEYLEDFYDD